MRALVLANGPLGPAPPLLESAAGADLYGQAATLSLLTFTLDSTNAVRVQLLP